MISPVGTARLDVGDALEHAVVDHFNRGANNFQVPTADQFVAYKTLVADTEAALQQGQDLQPVAEAASRIGCTLSQQDGCWWLQDAQSRGWGTVIFNAHPHSGLSPVRPGGRAEARETVVLEVPHPGFDWGTPELGWQAFRRFDADALVVAGAHRGNRSEPSPQVPGDKQDGAVANATYDPWKHAPGVPDYSVSDPTHAVDTPFEAAHEALAGPGSVVLQIHGFNAAKHHAMDANFPADRQIVLTPCANDHYNPPDLLAAADRLQHAGFETEVVSFADDASSELGAVVNVQHAWMAQHGLVGPGKPAQFIHMELDTTLRRGPQRDATYGRLLEALAPVFGSPQGRE